MNLGSNIKTLRLMKGLSQEELGARIGVKRAAVNKYEKGLVENIPIKTIERLGAILGVPPQDLLGWSDESKIPYEELTMQGVKLFHGNVALSLIESLSKLNDEGQQKVLQFSKDMERAFSNK